MKKIIKKELELIKIMDSSQNKIVDEKVTIVETRKVIIKNETGTWNLTNTAQKDESEFEGLDKNRDIGIPISLQLKIGESPQKSIQDFNKEEE